MTEATTTHPEPDAGKSRWVAIPVGYGELAAALAELQAELPHIEKSETAEVQTKTGGTYSYTYAGLATISEQIMPLLSKHGLSFIAKPIFSGERFVLACSLLHKSGEREDSEYPLPTSGTPQAIGSAITYGRRYCLCAMTGVAPEDDDDGAAAEAERAANKGTARRSTATRTPPPNPGRGAKKTAQRKPAGGQPPLPGEDEPDRITKPQLGKLHATFTELGITDRDAGLAYITDVVGREVESSKNLTKAEASKVIEKLQRDLEQPFPEGGDGDGADGAAAGESGA